MNAIERLHPPRREKCRVARRVNPRATYSARPPGRVEMQVEILPQRAERVIKELMHHKGLRKHDRVVTP